MQLKECNECKITKPVIEFYKESDMPDGYRNQCKLCRNAKTYARRNANPEAYNAYMQSWRRANPEAVKSIENKRYLNPVRQEYAKEHARKQRERGDNLVYMYGITKEQRFEILKKQNGCCAICNKHESTLKRGLCIDHCHKTKKVRGLLCDLCNKMLGQAKDSIEVLNKAVSYLSLSTSDKEVA